MESFASSRRQPPGITLLHSLRFGRSGRGFARTSYLRVFAW